MGEVAGYTREEWRDEAARRFGPDAMRWRFVCPVCGHAASVEDWRAAGAPEEAIAFSCVGRWRHWGKAPSGFAKRKPVGGCDYAGGGLFRLNPVRVTGGEGEPLQVFDFAPAA